MYSSFSFVHLTDPGPDHVVCDLISVNNPPQFNPQNPVPSISFTPGCTDIPTGSSSPDQSTRVSLSSIFQPPGGQPKSVVFGTAVDMTPRLDNAGALPTGPQPQQQQVRVA
jgi:hypothetical protein